MRHWHLQTPGDTALVLLQTGRRPVSSAHSHDDPFAVMKTTRLLSRVRAFNQSFPDLSQVVREAGGGEDNRAAEGQGQGCWGSSPAGLGATRGACNSKGPACLSHPLREGELIYLSQTRVQASFPLFSSTSGSFRCSSSSTNLNKA
ncbi:hypothetical protein VTI28DRAFT_10319 [Corynascus sepedonium]